MSLPQLIDRAAPSPLCWLSWTCIASPCWQQPRQRGKCQWVNSQSGDLLGRPEDLVNLWRPRRAGRSARWSARSTAAVRSGWAGGGISSTSSRATTRQPGQSQTTHVPILLRAALGLWSGWHQVDEMLELSVQDLSMIPAHDRSVGSLTVTSRAEVRIRGGLGVEIPSPDSPRTL